MNGRVTSEVFQTESFVLFHVQRINVLCYFPHLTDFILCQFSIIFSLHLIAVMCGRGVWRSMKKTLHCVLIQLIDSPGILDKSTELIA